MTSLPVWYKGLTPELRRKAELELGETSEIKTKALLDLKNLINEEENLYSRLDEVFLLRFLRHKKYNVEKAFQILRKHYNFRTKQRGTYTGRKPSDFKHVMDMHCVLYMPRRLESGSHVAIYRYGHFDTHSAKVHDFVSVAVILGEIILECEATQVSGGHFIFDLAGMNFQHCKHFTNFKLLLTLLNFVQDCFPERFKAFHILNESRFIYGIYRIMKPFFKSKILERLHFHGADLNSLHHFVPKAVLPEEFGGDMGPFNHQEFASYFFSQDEFIERINKYGYVKHISERKEDAVSNDLLTPQ